MQKKAYSEKVSFCLICIWLPIVAYTARFVLCANKSIFNTQDFQESEVIQKQTKGYSSLDNLNCLSTGSLQMSKKAASENWELFLKLFNSNYITMQNQLHRHLAETEI